MARVLIIEDDVGFLFALTEILTGGGHEVFRATDGSAGLTLIDAGLVPDVVILDYRMRPIDGMGFMAELAMRNVTWRHDRIIGITGHAEDFKNVRIVLEKPFEGWELLAAVEKVLNESTIDEKLEAHSGPAASKPGPDSGKFLVVTPSPTQRPGESSNLLILAVCAMVACFFWMGWEVLAMRAVSAPIVVVRHVERSPRLPPPDVRDVEPSWFVDRRSDLERKADDWRERLTMLEQRRAD